MMRPGNSSQSSESSIFSGCIGIRWSEIVNAGISMVCIESIEESSPAAECQRLKQGDILVLVDNTSVNGYRLREVLQNASFKPICSAIFM